MHQSIHLTQPIPAVYIRYSLDIEQELTLIVAVIEQVPALLAQFDNPRWLAIQLLEEDASLGTLVQQTQGGEHVLQARDEAIARLQVTYHDGVDLALTSQRYEFVHGIVAQVVDTKQSSLPLFTDSLDAVVTHPIFGIPILFAVMWAVFTLTTQATVPYLEWIDATISGPITQWVVALLMVVGLHHSWVESLVVDGVIAGVGGILVFVPVLMALYLLLALLEDSGYMARAAFVMHRFMQLIGLHGKSFLPMIVGFGCTVPALYATRTLERQTDRILTGLLVPFMSCSARLPVYILLAAIFFPNHAGIVISAMYLFGIIVAITIGYILKDTMFREREPAPFIMELPTYHVPSFNTIWKHMWQRTSSFVQKAGTLILAVSIIIWFLKAIPVDGDGSFANTPIEHSLFTTVAQQITPVFQPLGFGTWETSGALISGIIAKELIVSTMVQLHTTTQTSLSPEQAQEPTIVLPTARDVGHDIVHIVHDFGIATLDTIKSLPLVIGINLLNDKPTNDDEQPAHARSMIHQQFETNSGGYGSLAAVAFMVFVLLYTPCAATLAAERQELGLQWMWFSVVGQFVLAWCVAFVLFHAGQLMGLK